MHPFSCFICISLFLLSYSVEVNKIHECLEKLSKKHYPQVNDKVIKQIVSVGMKQIQALQFYCTETKLNYTWANVAPSVKNKLPPCAVSFDETANKCSKDFRSELQKTPKDSAAIYRYYSDWQNYIHWCKWFLTFFPAKA